MGFKSVVSFGPECKVTQSAQDFAGFGKPGGDFRLFPLVTIGGSTPNLDACSEERLAERTRIARELHDTLLQGFLSASMQLHAAVDQLPDDRAIGKSRFIRVLELLDRVIDEGRNALQGLRSSGERLTSIGEAFATVPNDLGLFPTADFRLLVQGREKELRAGVRDEVYRIGREAIINAFRHSGATEIEVEIEYRITELRIVVRDNGSGIAPAVLQHGCDGHWGLQGMRERAERVGAQLRLWSGVARGTEIELRVPGQVAFEQLASLAAH